MDRRRAASWERALSKKVEKGAEVETRGRPSEYRDTYPALARKACLLWGATDEELAEFFGKSLQTIHTWRKEHPAFAEACQQGKAMADANVVDRLYQRAIGYRHLAFKFFNVDGKIVKKRYVEHFPPDTMACMYWLNNRQRAEGKWRHRAQVEHTGKGGGPIEYRDLTEADIDKRISDLLDNGTNGHREEHAGNGRATRH